MTKILAILLALTTSAAAGEWDQFIDPNPGAPIKVTSHPLEIAKPAAAAPASHASKATKPAPKAKAKTKARKAKRH